MRRRISILCVCLCTLPVLLSQRRMISLEEVVNGGIVQVQGAGAMNWLPDGEHYYRIERAQEGGADVIKYNAVGERIGVLIPARMFRRSDTGGYLSVRSLTWSDDGRHVLIYTNTRRVWRYDTRGDYWVLNVHSGILRRLGQGLVGEESRLMFAKFSPDNKTVGYVYRNNIYVEDIETGTRRQLTTDGSEHIINGTFDWVYEEEFDCRDGFRFSPNGSYIAYWQSDTQGTGTFDIINNVDSLYPFTLRFPYPKAGTLNSAVKVGYIPVQGGATTTWISLPGEAREMYIPRMDFIPNSSELIIQQMNRAQNTNRVWLVNLRDNTPRNILTETDKAWVETNDNIVWLQNEQSFTWLSERSGYRHLYRVSRDGESITPITTGNFDVVRIAGIDPQRGKAYFIASPSNPTQRYLYSAPLTAKHPTTPTLLSPSAQKGTHAYTFSPTCRYAMHTFSNASTPPVVELLAMPSAKQVRLITDNAQARQQYNSLHWHPKQFLRLPSDSLLLDAWIIRPADFDSTKTYPVIIDIYGEPASSTVQDIYTGADAWHQYLAQEGYAVVSIDPRGAATPRGRAWRKCIYGEVGTLASRDIANAARALASRYTWINPQRIGITGWSGGGSQTLNCMFRYPDVFAAGIAIAFVADQRLYDTIYQERYMNTPQENPSGYHNGSPITHAEGLKGRLLLIHGTGDDNVHYQNAEMLVNALIRAGKLFQQLSYPMRTHSISEGQGTTLHLRRSMVDFWRRNL